MDLHNLFNVVVDEIFSDYCLYVGTDIERLYLYDAVIDEIEEEAVEMIL
jgi:hypothetical protein|tara:strand:+ start:224 stop:370 length:147 start_codon:yes stop_codon:yes gene_type:complete